MQYNSITLTTHQAFILWENCPGDSPMGSVKGQLFDMFGGVESPYYKEWVEREKTSKNKLPTEST